MNVLGIAFLLFFILSNSSEALAAASALKYFHLESSTMVKSSLVMGTESTSPSCLTASHMIRWAITVLVSWFSWSICISLKVENPRCSCLTMGQHKELLNLFPIVLQFLFLAENVEVELINARGLLKFMKLSLALIQEGLVLLQNLLTMLLRWNMSSLEQCL